MKNRSRSKKQFTILVGSLIVLAIIVLIGFALKSKDGRISMPPPPADGEIVLTGEVVCLPHKNTEGPQTMECAYGFKDSQGRYYGLRDTSENYENVAEAPMNVTVKLTGSFTAQEDPKYQSVGIIEVTEITEAEEL